MASAYTEQARQKEKLEDALQNVRNGKTAFSPCVPREVQHDKNLSSPETPDVNKQQILTFTI